MADSLAAALAAIQANPPKIAKRAKGQHGNYADLPAVAKVLYPALHSRGLLWQTWPTWLDGDFFLMWKITHLASGESLEGAYPIHAADPQKAGSEITYARRYALVTVTGVTPEGDDDDGQAASRTRTKVTGAEHERLRHGTVEATPDDRPAERLNGPDPDDPWAADADQAPPEDRFQLTPQQRSKIMRHLGKLSHSDRAARLSQIIARPVDSTNDLSVREAGIVIAELETRR